MKKRSILIAFTILMCILLSTALISCSPSDTQQGNNTTDPIPNDEEQTDTPPMELADADDLSYIVSDDGSYCYVLGLYSEIGAKNIEIPYNYNGIPITGIAEKAFASSQHLESVTIPDSVTHIGTSAFDGCYALENVQMSKNITFIGDGAFEGCDKLELAENDGAYYLGSTEAPYTVLLEAVNKDIESCTIHEDTRIIYEYAFADCTEVDKIIIPDGIMQIGVGAFIDCYDLEFNRHENAKYLGNENNPYLVLAESASSSVTECNVHTDTKLIAPAAFYDCDALDILVIPNGVKYIGPFAFEGCEQLTKITFDSITDWRVINGDELSKIIMIDTGDPEMAFLLRGSYCSFTFVKQ